MEILLKAHSGFRWLVLLVAVISLVVFLLNWLRQSNSSLDRTLMSIFLGCLDLQTLMGIILLLWAGFSGSGFTRPRLEHGLTMIIAVVLGHLSAKWKNSPVSIRARNNFITVLIILVLIYVGVARLPQGWSRMG